MKIVYGILTALAVVAGVYYLGMAFLTGSANNTPLASQLNQSMIGTYYGVMAIALFAFATFLAVAQKMGAD